MERTITMLSDEDSLVARAKTEPAAFAALYDHYFPRVYNYIRYRVGDPDTADDVTADTFEAILAGMDRYRVERGSFSTWIFAIARNAVNDHFRRQRFRRWLSLDLLFNRSTNEPVPEEILAMAETHKELLNATACLSQQDQDLIAHKFGAGLTNYQIANLTRLDQNNVNVRVYRAVGRLRNMLTRNKE